MVTNRRIGTEHSKTHAALLDATEQLMVEQGYAAVSSRRIAQKAGLKPQLVHYYFRTMDDLFLAAFRRRAKEGLERHSSARAAGQPLHTLWAAAEDPKGTALTMEFVALANHRKSIRSEIARYAELFRRQQTEVLTEVMEGHGIDTKALPPVALTVLMTSVSQILVIEQALGMSEGHAETRELVSRYLEHYEGESTPDPSAS